MEKELKLRSVQAVGGREEQGNLQLSHVYLHPWVSGPFQGPPKCSQFARFGPKSENLVF